MRIRIVADMLEEQWPSMDITADMLARYLPENSPEVTVDLFRPPMKRRFGRLSGGRLAMVDRLVGRHFDYPRRLQRCRPADVYHIVDQSYAAAANVLPKGRTVITCHDLDAFTPLRSPSRSMHGQILRRLARVTLRGLKSASRVVCDSETVKNELVALGWIPAHRIEIVPLGVHPTCSPSPDSGADASIERLLGPAVGPEILHVGSTIVRKRIDTLLESFAEVRRHRPHARLLRAGGAFTLEQQALAARLGLKGSIVVLPFLTRAELAAIYRRATVVVLPSQSEGFGLPIVEAMACGTPVLTSDIPVLREVGGQAASYAEVGDLHRWADSIMALLDEHDACDGRWLAREEHGLRHARQFTWAAHARQLLQVYQQILMKAAV